MTKIWVVITGAAFAVSGLFALSLLPLHQYRIPSEAMTPTLEVGSRLWTRSSDGTDVERDDIIVWDAPTENIRERVSRAVALGGDTVESIDHHLVVNGEPVVEDFLAPGMPTDRVDKLVVPVGSVYVLGDNRTNSEDSRYIGPVPHEQVVGKAVRVNAPDKGYFFGATLSFGILFAVALTAYRRERRSADLQL